MIEMEIMDQEVPLDYAEIVIKLQIIDKNVE
jgi:hypothetical protein